MKRCEECIHYEVCQCLEDSGQINKIHPDACGVYKHKSLFIELPCKVGTPVFIVNKTMGRIYPGKFRLDDIDQFGRGVFLTRAEAEKAVKGA